MRTHEVHGQAQLLHAIGRPRIRLHDEHEHIRPVLKGNYHLQRRVDELREGIGRSHHEVNTGVRGKRRFLLTLILQEQGKFRGPYQQKQRGIMIQRSFLERDLP